MNVLCIRDIVHSLSNDASQMIKSVHTRWAQKPVRKVGAHNSTYRGEITPFTHLFSAIYMGEITPFITIVFGPTWY